MPCQEHHSKGACSGLASHRQPCQVVTRAVTRVASLGQLLLMWLVAVCQLESWARAASWETGKPHSVCASAGVLCIGCVDW